MSVRATPLPIGLQLLDAAGGKASSAATSVTADDIAQVTASGTKTVKTLSGRFVFGSILEDKVSGYGYVVNTSGLGEGSCVLLFTAGNDPIIHQEPFSIKGPRN